MKKRQMRRVLGLFFWMTLMVLPCFGTGVSAQQILIQQEDVLNALEKEGYSAVEISNGPFFYTGAHPLEEGDITPFLPFMLSVLAHDQISEGHYTIETELFKLVPDLIEEETFVTPIRLGHLLTHSAGFAQPPVEPSLYRGDLRTLMMRQRIPGRLVAEDQVGLALLARVLETVANTPLDELLYRRFLAPLGLAADQISLFETTLLSGQIAKEARKALLSAITGRKVFEISKDVRADLFDVPLVEPFRGGAYASLGFSFDVLAQKSMIAAPGIESCILAFPQAGLAFWFDDRRACLFPYPQAVRDLAKDQIFDKPMAARLKNMQNPPRGVRYPDYFSGHYILDTPPRADLKSRLLRILDGGLRVRTLSDGTLQVQGDNWSRLLSPTRAYGFVDDDGEELIFSTYRRGGFLRYQGQTYRELGLLARRAYVLWPVPLIIVVLASAGFYRGVQSDPEWRRMALLGVLAALFSSLGLLAEIFLWDWALFGSVGKGLGPWLAVGLVVGWRLLINAALAFGIAITILALSLSRKAKFPKGVFALLAPLHLGALAASGVGLLIMMAAWGMAGELWPL